MTKPPNGAIVTCPRRDTTLRLVQALLLARSKVQGATRIVELQVSSPKIASKSEGACILCRVVREKYYYSMYGENEVRCSLQVRFLSDVEEEICLSWRGDSPSSRFPLSKRDLSETDALR